MTECWRFPNPFPALVCPHQPLTTELIVLCYGRAVDVDGGFLGGGRWALAGVHMPKNDASPLICSSVSHMNSFAARHTLRHTHTLIVTMHIHTDNPAVWPSTLFIAHLSMCARVCLCVCILRHLVFSIRMNFSRYICRLVVIGSSV